MPPAIESFPTVIVEKVRYSDTDRQGHVNNIQFAAFFEAGRVEILHGEDELSGAGCAFVLAKSTIEFLGELDWPGQVTIGTRVETIGTSSTHFRQALFQQGRCTALSDSVMVQVDLATRRGSALTDHARAALAAIMGPRPGV